MKNVETIILNNKEYLILKEIKINGVVYYILINVKDANDICVRKEIAENGNILMSMLDSEEELRMVLAEYKKAVEIK